MGIRRILFEISNGLAMLKLIAKNGRLIIVSVLIASMFQAWLPTLGFNVAASSPQYYVVAPGDTLTGIAQRFGISVATLAQLNGLRSLDFLQVGQTLTVGEVQPAPAPPPVAPPPSSSAPSSGSQRTHVVLPGETLMDIAQTYGVSVDDLASLNGLINPNFLRTQQVLVVPPSSSTSGSSDVVAQNPDLQLLMRMPYRSQFDGTLYEEGNCGPATLGMLMDYYGQHWSTNELRRSVNKYSGYYAVDGGSDWESLVYSTEVHGFRAKGLYDGQKHYRQWTVDELVQEVQAGRPVMLLVRYQTLPGHEYQGWWGDHYIAFLGLTPDGDVIYHDSAFRGDSSGAYRTMSKDRLLRSWAGTSVGIRYSAMSLEWLGR